MSLLSSMPFPILFLLAFLVVLGLIAGAAWVVKGFGAGRVGNGATRGRQPRLAVVDHASVDGRRRLLIIRRDNVEHLVMIGGPTDVVVETNIVRGAAAATRDVSVTRIPAGSDALPRAIPLPDSAGNGSWPLQPEPAGGATVSRTARSEDEEPASWPLSSQPEAPARTNRETLTALHDELSSRPVPLPRSRPQAGPRPLSSAPAPVAEPGEAVDQSLAEMAHRLEAALRKPSAKPDPVREVRPISMPRSATPAEPSPLDELGTPPPRAAETRQPTAGKMLYDSLEQEMASLLGRPTSKI